MTRWDMEAEQRVCRPKCEVIIPQKSENSSLSAQYLKTGDCVVYCAFQ